VERLLVCHGTRGDGGKKRVTGQIETVRKWETPCWARGQGGEEELEVKAGANDEISFAVYGRVTYAGVGVLAPLINATNGIRRALWSSKYKYRDNIEGPNT
jgi:hypothetical protein